VRGVLVNNRSILRYTEARDPTLRLKPHFITEGVGISAFDSDSVLLVVWKEGHWQNVGVVATNDLELLDHCGFKRCRLPWQQISKPDGNDLVIFLAFDEDRGVAASNSVLVRFLCLLLFGNLRVDDPVVD